MADPETQETDDRNGAVREEAQDSYALDRKLRSDLRAAIDAADVAEVDALMEPLHPADIAGWSRFSSTRPDRPGWPDYTAGCSGAAHKDNLRRFDAN